MIRYFIVLLLASSPFIAVGQTAKDYGRNGTYEGRSETTGNITKRYNQNGVPKGRSERNGNTITDYDRNGMLLGRTIIEDKGRRCRTDNNGKSLGCSP